MAIKDRMELEELLKELTAAQILLNELNWKFAAIYDRCTFEERQTAFHAAGLGTLISDLREKYEK